MHIETSEFWPRGFWNLMFTSSQPQAVPQMLARWMPVVAETPDNPEN